MTFDLWFFCIAGPAVLFAGISKGGFGSGAAFASSSILALVIEPGLALGIMLPLLMLIDATTLRPYWGKWSLHEVKLLILGGIPGVLLGAALYKVASADFFRLLIGSISVGFVIWQWGRSAGWIRAAQQAMPNWLGIFWGSVAGFTSFVSHAGGPPAAIYLLSRGLTKTLSGINGAAVLDNQYLEVYPLRISGDIHVGHDDSRSCACPLCCSWRVDRRQSTSVHF